MQVVAFDVKYIAEFCNILKRTKRQNQLVLLILSFLVTALSVSLMLNLPAFLYFSKTTEKSRNSVDTKALIQKEKLYARSVESAEQKAAELIKAGATGLLQEEGRVAGDSEYNAGDVFSAYNGEEAPKLTVKAIIKVSGKISACVDINGVAEGIIMMPGMSFLTHGKINAINEKSVEWEWKGKKIKTEF